MSTDIEKIGGDGIARSLQWGLLSHFHFLLSRCKESAFFCIILLCYCFRMNLWRECKVKERFRVQCGHKSCHLVSNLVDMFLGLSFLSVMVVCDSMNS